MPATDKHTSDLIAFCRECRWRELDYTVTDAAIRHLIDIVGVIMAGVKADSSKVVGEFAAEQGGTSEAIVIGSKELLLPAASAAFCNGVSAHALELDDVHTPSSLHPGAVVIPAALAMSERMQADGETVVRAIILGYEVMTRMGMAVDPKTHYARGFHPTSTCGCFGALAAAGLVLNLSSDEFLNGFGIAASLASGLLEFSHSGSWVKRLHTGWAARSGVTAAMLAKKGFTGPPTAITGPYGFLKSFSHSARPERLSLNLGETYAICNTQVKYYACCTYQHAALTGVIDLMKTYGVKCSEIRKIEIGVVQPAIPLTYEPRETKVAPQSIVEAQFSLPYGIAVATLFGDASIKQYTHQLLRDPRVLDLASKVYVFYDSALDKYYPRYFPATVKILLTDGSTLSCTTISPKGHPENPLTDDELERRFILLASATIPQQKARALLGALCKVMELKDVRMLSGLLST